MSDITQAAERHVRIPDSFFGEESGGENRIFYLEPTVNGSGAAQRASHNVANFTPVGIKVGRHHSDPNKQQDSTLTMATVRGFLHNETPDDMDDHEIVIGPMEPIRFRGIQVRNTDGRRIVIYGA